MTVRFNIYPRGNISLIVVSGEQVWPFIGICIMHDSPNQAQVAFNWYVLRHDLHITYSLSKEYQYKDRTRGGFIQCPIDWEFHAISLCHDRGSLSTRKIIFPPFVQVSWHHSFECHRNTCILSALFSAFMSTIFLFPLSRSCSITSWFLSPSRYLVPFSR